MSDPSQAADALEREVLASTFENCPQEARDALGLQLFEIAGALVTAARHAPNILLNRTVWSDVRSGVDQAIVGQIAGAYRDLGIGDYFLQVRDADLSEAARRAIREAGLVRARGWMKFRRGVEPPGHAAQTDLTVEEIGPDKAEDFAALVCGVFGLGAGAAPMVAGIVGAPGWRVFMSHDGGVPAGAGALFVSGGSGWVGFGATRPDFRRRGSQGAILAARIGRAAELGCTQLFTETGEAVEGEAQTSYGNILKYGFREIGLRQNYRPAQ